MMQSVTQGLRYNPDFKRTKIQSEFVQHFQMFSLKTGHVLLREEICVESSYCLECLSMPSVLSLLLSQGAGGPKTDFIC